MGFLPEFPHVGGKRLGNAVAEVLGDDGFECAKDRQNGEAGKVGVGVATAARDLVLEFVLTEGTVAEKSQPKKAVEVFGEFFGQGFEQLAFGAFVYGHTEGAEHGVVPAFGMLEGGEFPDFLDCLVILVEVWVAHVRLLSPQGLNI